MHDSTPLSTLIKTLITACFLFTLSACSGDSDVDTEAASETATEIPEFIQNISALTVAGGELKASITIDGGTPIPMAVDLLNGTSSIKAKNLEISVHVITITYTYTDAKSTETVTLATATKNIDLANSNTLSFGTSDYNIDKHDDDNDGISNLAEIKNGTDPTFANINPLIPLTPLTSIEVLRLPGRTITFEGGFEGNIEVISDPNFLISFQLSNGIPSLNVNNIQKTEALDLSCADGNNINGTSISNYSTGVVTRNAKINDISTSCSSTFVSVVPTTISNDLDISDLLEWGTDDDLAFAAETGLLATTCPQEDDNNFIDFDPVTINCTGSLFSNQIITDDSGGTHLLSTKLTLLPDPTTPDPSSGALTVSGNGVPQLAPPTFTPTNFFEDAFTISWLDVPNDTFITVLLSDPPGAADIVIVAVAGENWSAFSPAGINISAGAVTFSGLTLINDVNPNDFITLDGTLFRDAVIIVN